MEDNILEYLETNFEKNLFSASIAYLKNEDDPLRFNSFAYSLRELIRNAFSQRAPEDAVKSCCWFKKETDNGISTRKQKYKYCVQGGLSDEFVKRELSIDILENWKEIKKTIDTLSKYTHISESTFNLPKGDCERLSQEALGVVLQIFEMIDDVRSELRNELTHHIQNELLSVAISTTLEDIDILSQQSYIEDVEVEEHEVVNIENNDVRVEGSGSIYVSLNYDKGEDATELNETFPFTFTGISSVDEPYSVVITRQNINIDTSSWYE